MKFTVSKKLWSGFLSLLLLMVIIGGAGFWSLSKTNSSFNALMYNQVSKTIVFDEMGSLQKGLSGDVQGYLLYGQESFLNNRAKIIEELDRKSGLLEKMEWSDSERALLDELAEARMNYIQTMDLAISEFSEGNKEKAMNITIDATLIQAEIMEKIDELITYQTDQTYQVNGDIQS